MWGNQINTKYRGGDAKKKGNRLLISERFQAEIPAQFFPLGQAGSFLKQV